jgi:hypothetical protein
MRAIFSTTDFFARHEYLSLALIGVLVCVAGSF